jgi:hypothetical protein
VRGSCACLGRKDDDLKRPQFLIGVAVWGTGLLGLALTPFYLSQFAAGPSLLLAAVWATAAVIFLLVVAVAFVRRQVAVAAGAMGIGMAVLAVVMFGLLLPGLPDLAASRAVAYQLRALGAGAATPVAMIDYREPSLAFYQGGGAREMEVGGLSSATPPQWAVMTLAGWEKLPPEIRTRYTMVGTPTPAFVYNDGQRMLQIIIVRAKRVD